MLRIIPLRADADDFGVYGPAPRILFRGTLDECLEYRNQS